MRPSGSERDAAAGPLGIYVHIPFCAVRCSYCDFPTVAGRDDRMDAYHRALEAEIGRMQPDAAGAADTVFFGGGTPSRTPPATIAAILAALRSRFALAADAEVTLEGNPESLTRGALEGFRDAGITRVSVGVQSLDDAVLARAGRAHDAADARRAVRDARSAGFASVSLDLIAGLPGEDLDAWGATIAAAAALEPDHVSVYLLESDKDTPLGRSVRSGRTLLADEDAMARAYETSIDVLSRHGLALYEISNFARPGHRSRHNLKYWTDVPYAGFGLGAAGYVAGERRTNRRDLDGYVEAVGRDESPVADSEPFDAARRLEEALFLGLRVVEGVDVDALGARYDADVRARFAPAWERAAQAGLVVWGGARVALTRAGRLRSNEVFSEIVGAGR